MRSYRFMLGRLPLLIFIVPPFSVVVGSYKLVENGPLDRWKVICVNPLVVKKGTELID